MHTHRVVARGRERKTEFSFVDLLPADAHLSQDWARLNQNRELEPLSRSPVSPQEPNSLRPHCCLLGCALAGVPTAAFQMGRQASQLLS